MGLNLNNVKLIHFHLLEFLVNSNPMSTKWTAIRTKTASFDSVNDDIQLIHPKSRSLWKNCSSAQINTDWSSVQQIKQQHFVFAFVEIAQYIEFNKYWRCFVRFYCLRKLCAGYCAKKALNIRCPLFFSLDLSLHTPIYLLSIPFITCYFVNKACICGQCTPSVPSPSKSANICR